MILGWLKTIEIQFSWAMLVGQNPPRIQCSWLDIYLFQAIHLPMLKFTWLETRVTTWNMDELWHYGPYGT